MKLKCTDIIFKLLLSGLVTMVLGGFPAISAIARNHSEKEILTAGCKTAYFLMKDLEEAYRLKTNTKILPKRTGNRVAVKLLVAGDIDFAFTCQPHENLAKSNNLAPQQVKDWHSVRIARDPVVVVINLQNKMDNLTKNQLTDIFSGKITNWKDVGGDDLEVKLTYQDDSIQSGVNVVFREQTVGRINGELQKLSHNAVRFPGPKKRGAFISQNPGSITFMGLSAYRERYGKILKINNAAPTRENFINGSYPLAATYYIIYDENKKSIVEPFFKYISSKEGQAAININFLSDIETSF
ncbi:MAG: substrate-binding domain-containing protein [Desulfobulbaceae bacterium]|nr:substrate-binding domain-containing protein [Desulfobulbaceae bacterium]